MSLVTLNTPKALADATDLLIRRGHSAAADTLTQCMLIVDFSEQLHDDVAGDFLAAELALLYPSTHTGLAASIPDDIHAALRDALPRDVWINKLVSRPLPDTISSQVTDVRQPIQASPYPPSNPALHNQAVSAVAPRIWNNLRFRSESELRIAQALDRTGVLFLPNCLARLGTPSDRQNREPDFLICDHGKWGILEVDGEPFHPPSRTVHDHERARLFKTHGIRVVEHFDAGECYGNPDAVVAKFLQLLHQGEVSP